MTSDLRIPAVILSPNSLRLERIFGRPNLGPLEFHFGFLAKNDVNHVQVIGNILWIVIYAYPRSVWAQTRRNWREFLYGRIWGPCSAILGFWPKTMKIMYKSLLILYESWSTYARGHFKPNLLRLERIFGRPNLGPLMCHFGFLAKNDRNHVQIMGNIVWIVMYAYPG